MPNESYEVGYMKPPKTTQWKKGQSGNPSGKKKGSTKPPEPLLACLAKQLSMPVETVLKGKKTAMALAEVLVLKLLQEIMAGSVDQKIKALAMFDKLGVLGLQQSLAEAAQADEPIFFTEEDRRLLEIARAEIDEEGSWESTPG